MADRWLTYEEAGEPFGLSADAMRKRARRLGWRVQAGNDGRARVLVPEGAGLGPDGRSGRPPGRPDDRADGLPVELRRRAEAAEARAEAAEVREMEQRERAARAEGEAAGLREGYQQAQGRAERAEAAAAMSRDAAVQAMAQAAAERSARQASEAAWHAAEAEAAAARAELAGWTTGGPVVRAWRAFLSRRGRS